MPNLLGILPERAVLYVHRKYAVPPRLFETVPRDYQPHGWLPEVLGMQTPVFYQPAKIVSLLEGHRKGQDSCSTNQMHFIRIILSHLRSHLCLSAEVAGPPRTEAGYRDSNYSGLGLSHHNVLLLSHHLEL